jgi:hypothetical protein
MNLELMTARRLTAGLVYPPRQLQKAQLTSLYATITSRYEYAQFNMLPDGARLGHGQDSECFIQAGRIQINETIRTHFEMSKEKAIDLFQTIVADLGINQFVAFGVKLIASCPAGENADASRQIETGFLRVGDAEFDRLGPGRRGTGIRVNLHRDGIYDIRIEPLLRDMRHLHVELDVQFPEPFTDLGNLETRMDGAYNYLFGELKDFMAAALSG